MSNTGTAPHEPLVGGGVLCPCVGCGQRRAAVTAKVGTDFPAIGATVVRGLIEGA
jgi:hypothetical protein